MAGLFGLFVGATPASPTPPAVGAAHVSCIAYFPHVPGTVQWTEGGTCNGVATVTAAGQDNLGNPFVLDSDGPFAASFHYYEPCLLDGQPDIFVSFSEGTFTVSNLQTKRVSQRQEDGFPQVTELTATIAGSYSWSRIGLNPVITVSDLLVTFSDGVTATGSGGIEGVGTATFVPPGDFDNSKHLLCGQGGGSLTIPVEAAVTVSFL